MLPDGAKTGRNESDAELKVAASAYQPRHLWARLSAWVRAEGLLVAILFGVFLARLLVLDRNSYWLDEVYSVSIHGTWNGSLTDLVRTLANTTVYPPLYFAALYEWMSLFGSAEFATRLLSNILVTLSAVFLYLSLRLGVSRRTAILSVVAFSLMYTTMYYGLETRPYALNIFLVTVSSYLLLRLLRRSTEVGWKHALISPGGAAFVVVNAAVLLTHYYNVFFWIAQGVAACVYVLWDLRPRLWLRGLIAVAVLYGMQGAIFIGVWGRNTIDAVDRQAAANTIEGAGELPNPLSVLLNSVVFPNFDLPLLLKWVAVALLAAVLVEAVIILIKTSSVAKRLQAWLVVALFFWLFLPFGVMYVTFLAAGLARFSERYFVFSVVPLAPLAVMTIERAVRMVARVALRLKGRLSSVGRRAADNWKAWATVLTVIMIVVLILPGTLEAVRAPKADWRGTADEIVNIVESNPDSSYAIYETSFRSTPIFDYYLARYSDDVRVMGTIARFEERRGRFAFEQKLDAIAQHDFLIVPFIHHRVDNFPKAMEKLQDLYEVQYWEIDEKGKGMVIFSTSGGARDARDG